MVKILRIPAVVTLSAGMFFSCGDLNRKVDEKIDKLMEKTESLDSLVNKEVEAFELDSLINKGIETTKKLDSLIDKSASRLDSIVNEKINPNN